MSKAIEEQKKIVRGIPRASKQEAYKRAGYRCQKCATGDDLTLHHKIPVSEGGGNGSDNLALLCKTCHLEWHRYMQQYAAGVSFERWLKWARMDVVTLALYLFSDGDDDMTLAEFKKRIRPNRSQKASQKPCQTQTKRKRETRIWD